MPVPDKLPVLPPKYAAFLDEKTGKVHLENCSIIEDYSGLKGFMKLSSCVVKGYTPCPVCCADTWKRILVERNKDIVERAECRYFYFKGSPVFHLGNCRYILNAQRAFNTVARYETCVNAGRSPCKICKPIPGLYDKLTHNEKKAYNRYLEARSERDQRAKEYLRGTEFSDMITLTSTGYAFWSAPGYSTFHLRACPKLKEMHEVIGFAKYADALNAGYEPCRICKPKKKYDVRVSIPINNRVRENEKIEDIFALCETLNLSYSYNSPLLEITTPLGKWRIHTAIRPIIVDHMPFHPDEDKEPKYHRQHRIFMSLTDTVHYISRHDEGG
jgi:methylphosphotriester-DNA--protein-cysteine methyltransferase